MPDPGKSKRSIDQLSLFNGDVVLLSIDNVKNGEPSDMVELETKGMSNYLSRIEGQDAFELIQKAHRKLADISIY